MAAGTVGGWEEAEEEAKEEEEEGEPWTVGTWQLASPPKDIFNLLGNRYFREELRGRRARAWRGQARTHTHTHTPARLPGPPPASA